MQRIGIGVLGVTGRMGRLVAQAVLDSPDLKLTGASCRADSAAAGRDVALILGHAEPCGVAANPDLAKLAASADVIVDFSTPAASLDLADALEAAPTAAPTGRAAWLCATTGLSAAQQARVQALASHRAVLPAANTSLGVTLLQALVTEAASRLGAAHFDIEIVETHHRHKADAPSGTALALGRAAALGRGGDLDALAIRSRDGLTGPRPRGAIGFAALRGGDVPGEHSVLFLGDNERVELTHRATDRRLFADGALAAARWLAGQPAGLYAMREVLGL